MTLLIGLPLLGLLGLAAVAARAPVAVPGGAVTWIEGHLNARLREPGVVPGEAPGEAQGEGGAHLSLGRLSLGFDPGQYTFGLVSRDAALVGAGAGGARIDLPRLTLTLDAAQALRGRIAARRLQVAGAALRLTRAVDGTVTLGFGQSAAVAVLPTTPEAAMQWVGQILGDPRLAGIARIEASDLRLDLEDLGRNQITTLRDGALVFENNGPRQSLSGVIEMEDTGGAAGLLVTRQPGARGQPPGLTVQLQVDDVSAASLGALLAPDHGLAALGAALSGGAEARLSAAGRLETLAGWLELGPGQIPVAAPVPLGFDHALAELRYEPLTGRVLIDELSFHGDYLRFVTSGQALIEGPGRGVVQVDLEALEVDPDALRGAPMRFDGGLLEARVRLQPFEMQIGQAMLARGGEHLRGAGALRLEGTHLRGGLSLSAPRIEVASLRALWPEAVAPKVRAWVQRSLLGGALRDVALAVQLPPGGARPKLSGSFAIEEAKVAFLRDFPPLEGGFGLGSLDDNRLVLRIDRGRVLSGSGGSVSAAGTQVVLGDLTQRPGLLEVDLVAAGAVPDLLRVLDNPPFEVLKKSGRSADTVEDLVQGQARVAGRILVPLVRKVPFEAVRFGLEGTLRDLRSAGLVAGRQLAAQRLALVINDREGVRISGAASLEGLDLDFAWRQKIVAPGAAPEAAQLSGVARFDRAGLARLGVDLSALGPVGAGRAEFALDMLPGVPGTLRLASDLQGLGLSIPALNWRKRREARAEFSLALPLGPVSGGRGAKSAPFRLEAPGLSTSGRLDLAPSGGLLALELERTRVGGWLDARAVTLRPQGPGKPLAIALRAGSVDLRQWQAGGSGETSGAGADLEVEIDRLIVSDGISLRDARGDLRARAGALSGDLRASLNGKAPLRAQVSSGENGPIFRVTGADAGQILAAAGVFKNAIGGAFDLRLEATGTKGSYRGNLEIGRLRVRNAPTLAALLSAISVVGLVEQLTGEGLAFGAVEAEFLLTPEQIVIRRSSAVGPSMAITADGRYTQEGQILDLAGVISPLYVVNGVFGALLAGRRNEGLLGMNYTLRGTADAPRVQVNPLSALTPGIFREIFRRPAPEIGPE